MYKIWFIIVSIFLIQPVFSQNSLSLETTGITFKDQEQLENLYIRHNQSMLIVEKQIYFLPCECSPCRNSGGDNEGRNSGGDKDGRNSGSEGDERNFGGDTDGRNQGEDTDGRNQGGEAEGRNQGSDAEGRNFGGDSDERNQDGEKEGRNFDGDTDGRNAGAEDEGRNQGGDAEGRNAGADTESRTGDGEISSFGCERKSRKKLHFYNINKNAEVYYFDGFELTKVNMSKGVVKP